MGGLVVMAKTKTTSREGRRGVKDTLMRISERFDECKSAKPGDIVFHLSGIDAGTYTLHFAEGKANVAESGPANERAPLIEVIGDARRVRAVLAGEKNAVEQF